MSPSNAENAEGSALVSLPELAVADTVGKLMQFWGFKRPMGRVWSVLYLSPEPLTAADLSESLKMSAGAVSMALAELEKWGAIVRTWTPGDRRDFFSAEADIWKLVQGVVQRRELSLVRSFTQSLQAASDDLDSEQRALNEADDRHFARHRVLDYKRRRLGQLRSLSEAGELLLSALVKGAPIDPGIVLRTGSQD